MSDSSNSPAIRIHLMADTKFSNLMKVQTNFSIYEREFDSTLRKLRDTQGITSISEPNKHELNVYSSNMFDLDRIAAMVVYIIGEAVGHDIELEILPAARANHRIKVFLEEMKLLARRKALTNELNVLEGDITYEQELVAHYLDEYVTPHRKTLARLKREADKLRKQLNG